MSRGGPQNRGKTLVHNTSGLAGIRFAWLRSRCGDWLYPYVRVAVHARGKQSQRSFSVNHLGRGVAIERALATRKAAGYQAPPKADALRALERFLSGR